MVNNKGLWGTTLCLARRETDTNVKGKHNRDKRDTSRQDRVVYTEHCTSRGELSKVNQVTTSNSMPTRNTDPINIELLRTKHPEPAHPARDPVRISSTL